MVRVRTNWDRYGVFSPTFAPLFGGLRSTRFARVDGPYPTATEEDREQIRALKVRVWEAGVRAKSSQSWCGAFERMVGSMRIDANVLTNLSLGHSLDSLVDLGESFSSTVRLKIFAGYAGWSPGQLEDEMKRDTWMTHPASLELVFHPNPEQLWPAILKEKGWKYKLIAESPEDPSWN
jgi:hypothetical protein